MKRLKNFCSIRSPVFAAGGLIVFLFLTQDGACAASQAKPQSPAPKKAVGPQENKKAVSLTVYYFHGYARCASCRKIERYSREAAESFASGKYAGRVAFSAVNIEEPQNSHYINDYQLVSKAVVLQPERGGKTGKWKNLDRIWLELGDREKFVAYVKDAITRSLEEK